jgi:predicted Zn finger-like uncharacterized protein
MFTRCPACHTVHPLNAALLARANGQYRCGKCHQLNNALEALFDEWPDAAEKPTESGRPPELGAPIKLDEASLGGDEDFQAPKILTAKKSGNRVWVALAVALALVTLLNFSNAYRQELAGIPVLRSIMVKLGLAQAKQERAFRDLSMIQVVSRDMRNDPEQGGVLLLSVTMVNRAEQTQAFPRLEITLKDTLDQPLARRVIEPRNYLPAGVDIAAGMTPEAYLPFIIEFVDPGLEAVGFELEFR